MKQRTTYNLAIKITRFFLLSHSYQREAKRQGEHRLKLKKSISKVCEENKEAASLLTLFKVSVFGTAHG